MIDSRIALCCSWTTSTRTKGNFKTRLIQHVNLSLCLSSCQPFARFNLHLCKWKISYLPGKSIDQLLRYSTKKNNTQVPSHIIAWSHLQQKHYNILIQCLLNTQIFFRRPKICIRISLCVQCIYQ